MEGKGGGRPQLAAAHQLHEHRHAVPREPPLVGGLAREVEQRVERVAQQLRVREAPQRLGAVALPLFTNDCTG